MQVTPHVYVMHIDDGAVSHPGGSNNYFVGEPSEDMVLVDTGEQHQQREQQVLAALARGLTEVKDIARAVYPRNLPHGLRLGAERNVATHLEKLRQEGRVVATPPRYALRGEH